jgi:protein SCO1/2
MAYTVYATLLCVIVIALAARPAYAHSEHHEHGDEHAGHHMAATNAQQEPARSTANYVIPSIQLVRATDNKSINFAQEIDDDRPVVLNFIYSTCTEICPLTTKVFADFQTKLGKNRNQVHLVSVSIDPEQDTPTTLKNYAKKYHAGKNWNFYTGTAEASLEIQKAFDAYRGDKMNHVPATYLRAAPGKPWLRLDGLISADTLQRNYQELISQ